MNNFKTLNYRYRLNKLLNKNVKGGRILGIKYGINANSGSIGSFVYAIPSIVFLILAFVSVGIGLFSNYLFSRGES